MKENIALVRNTLKKLKYFPWLEKVCALDDRLLKISVLQVNPSNTIENYLKTSPETCQSHWNFILHTKSILVQPLVMSANEYMGRVEISITERKRCKLSKAEYERRRLLIFCRTCKQYLQALLDLPCPCCIPVLSTLT